MKGIFYRLTIIITLFYLLILFLFYVLFLRKNSLYLNQFIIFFFISSLFYIFIIYLIFRTSNYIVNPIKSIINNFKKFPNWDSSYIVYSKITEIQILTDFINKFMETYSNYLSELNLEKNLLNSLLNNLKEGVVCLSDTGEILYINEFLLEHFCDNDFLYSNLKNKKYYEIITNPTLLDIIYKIFNNKNSQYIFSVIKKENNILEFFNKDKFYQLRYYEISLESYLSKEVENFNLTNLREKLYLFIINDITQEYNTKRMREDFLQNASHELKTPITSIKGYSETILDRIHEPSFDRKILTQFLQGILRNTERMERIIHDMVLISSLESNQYPFHPVDIDLVHFFQELEILVEGLLKPKKLKLEYKFLGNFPKIFADPLLLEHLLLNLISNAARYSNENQKIQIIVKKVNGGKILISIIDNGPGIPDEYKNKIFERFFRIDKDRSRKEGGTGLGLSIVRQIVRIHNGSIQVVDNPEGGAIFNIYLPI